MRDVEIQTLVDMIEGEWGSLGDAAIMWRGYLEGQDAAVVTKAIAHLATVQKKRPHLADLAEVVRTMLPQDRALVKGVCTTCGDDRFVLVSTRVPSQTPWMKAHGIEPDAETGFEEYAPCPDCNSLADTTFRRADGSLFVGPDPATVKARMRL